MNKEIKAKWIEALRSGKYKQTTEGVLYDGNAYCCLGVLCAEIGLRAEPNEAGDIWYFWAGAQRDYEALPGPIANQIGLTPMGDLPEKVAFGEKEFTDLAALNDRGADFNFIADVIEKQL